MRLITTPVIVFFLAADLFAGTIDWFNTAGGTFQSGNNWVGGVAPGSNDSAIFGYNSTFKAAPQPIGITFSASAANFNADVQDAAFTFNLGGNTYSPGFINIGNARDADAVAGTAILNISNGTVSDASGVMGFVAGSSGTVNLSGANSTWNNSSFVQVGASGAGVLNILNGAKVTGQALDLGVFVAGASGTVTLSGVGSSWTGSGALDFVRVGNNGSGSLNVNGGATGSNSGAFIIGAPGSGTVLLSDSGTSWTSAGQAQVGNGGTGILTVTNSATLTTNKGTSATTSAGVGAGGGTGTVTISNGGVWNQDASMRVAIGSTSTGTVSVTSGGVINSGSGVISAQSGGVGVGGFGTVVVSGAGSAWHNTTTLDVGVAGPGILTVANGGLVSATTVTIGTSGLLNGGGGTVQGTVIDHGVVRPGNSPGTLNINGDFTLAPDGTLIFEIDGPLTSQYSHLNIAGIGNFNGLIDFLFANAYAPHAGDVFSFINDTGGIGSIAGLTFKVDGLQPGFQFNAGFNNGTFGLTALTTGVSAVPEPATMAIAILGLAVIGVRRRVRK